MMPPTEKNLVHTSTASVLYAWIGERWVGMVMKSKDPRRY